MLYGFFNRIAPTVNLRESLDASSQRTRLIADRVSKATLQNQDGFAIPGMEAAPGTEGEGPVDLESEMVSLADEQLRFEATARLLQRTYQQIRTSLRDR
jgi:flagellar basal body rod protein FlgB